MSLKVLIKWMCLTQILIRKLLSKNNSPKMLLLLVYSIFNLCQKYPYFRNRLTIIKMYKM